MQGIQDGWSRRLLLWTLKGLAGRGHDGNDGHCGLPIECTVRCEMAQLHRHPPSVSRPSLGESWLALAAAVVLALLHLLIAHWRGALGASRNDDWAFYRIAYVWADDNVITLNGWVQMMFVGQAWLAWPVVKLFGPEIAPLQVMVALLGALGLWAAYLVVRTFLTRAWAALAVACLALGPVFGSLSVSFMTDVPSFSLQMLCLLAGQRALRPAAVSGGWFVVSLAFAVAAFSIREYGAAAGLAVSIAVLARAWSSADRRQFRRLGAAAAATLALVVVLFMWRGRLPNSTTTQLAISRSELVAAAKTLVMAAVTLALFVVPAVLALSPPKLIRHLATRLSVVGRSVCVAFIAAPTLVLLTLKGPVLLGNYVSQTGSYSVTVGGAGHLVVPRMAWFVLGTIGCASFVVIALLVVAGLSHDEPRVLRGLRLRPALPTGPAALVQLFTACTLVVAIAAVSLTTAPYFDRYLISLVPFVAALVIHAGRERELLARRSSATASLSLAVLGLVGLVYIDASAAFDGAKWKLASAVEDLGFEAPTIDGGFEWFGYHQSDATGPSRALEGRNFWISMFDDRPVCATSVRQTPQIDAGDDEAGANQPVIASVTVRSFLVPDYELASYVGPEVCDR